MTRHTNDPVDVFVDQLANTLLPELAGALRLDGNAFESATLKVLSTIVSSMAQMMRDELAME